MEFRRLGRAGLKVSELGLGSSMFTFVCQKDNLQSVREIVRAASEAGITHFDTAERYGLGLAELVLGEVLREYPRDQIVVSTKLLLGGTHVHQRGLSRKHLREGMEGSLRRLQMDYVDLVYCHRYDDEVPIEEVVRGMDDLLRSGAALYWGTSEWTAEQIAEAHSVARELGCVPPTMEQTEYNLFTRVRVEREYLPLYEQFGMGLVAYGPLAGGVLTGKHNEGIVESSRIGRYEMLVEEYASEEKLHRAHDLAAVAHDLDVPLAQLSLAWCLRNPNVSSVLLGVTSKEQLAENLKALEVKEKLTGDVLARIEEILAAPAFTRAGS